MTVSRSEFEDLKARVEKNGADIMLYRGITKEHDEEIKGLLDHVATIMEALTKILEGSVPSGTPRQDKTVVWSDKKIEIFGRGLTSWGAKRLFAYVGGRWPVKSIDLDKYTPTVEEFEAMTGVSFEALPFYEDYRAFGSAVTGAMQAARYDDVFRVVPLDIDWYDHVKGERAKEPGKVVKKVAGWHRSDEPQGVSPTAGKPPDLFPQWWIKAKKYAEESYGIPDWVFDHFLRGFQEKQDAFQRIKELGEPVKLDDLNHAMDVAIEFSGVPQDTYGVIKENARRKASLSDVLVDIPAHVSRWRIEIAVAQAVKDRE